MLRAPLCSDTLPRPRVRGGAVRGSLLRSQTSLRLALATCFAAALLVSGCSSVPFGSQASANRASSASVDCRALAQRGVTACPPGNPALGSPQRVNHSEGLASPAQFRQYARALLRSLAYERFALDTSQASILKLGALVTNQATDFVYSADLSEIVAAKKQGAKLTDVGSISTIKLVALSSVDQSDIQSAGYTPSRFAWIVTWSGLRGAFATTDSTFDVMWSASNTAAQLFWGTYQSSTALGPIWTFDGSSECTFSAIAQSICAK